MTSGAKASPDLANTVSYAQELARQIASASTATEALKINDLNNLTAVLAASKPNVDLNLPGLSGSIHASLPKSLAETYLPRAPKQATPAKEAPGSDELIDSPEALGLMVRRAREHQGLSQQRFADLAGVGRRFVSELENGKPTLELGKVLSVAHAAGLSILARAR